MSDKAQSDLYSIFEHYKSKTGEDKAHDIVRELLSKLDDLKVFPAMGRASQVPDVRELVFTFIPFLAPYRLNVPTDTVEVIRILHQRTERPQDW
ncbi:type II toxin-antitoxin system RelE/ParE family toxin [Pseudomonas tohonis]|uniref:type II toxin-antitoxin system RelE/ParE family toxin n=1 Tax=Pseudomonas tohonis TaxID=2725477 RepID=UPI0022EFFE3B|nr:type II toxin-antitoxin system RelE/ParE family toxin [Pseudomonas tohonis]